MNEPTEIKYSLDENGEPYYAATHIQAVHGMENMKTNIDDLIETYTELKAMENRISEQGILLDYLQKELQKLQTEKVKSE